MSTPTDSPSGAPDRDPVQEARGLAVDLHKHLNAARNATAHIISQDADDGHETMSWDQP